MNIHPYLASASGVKDWVMAPFNCSEDRIQKCLISIMVKSEESHEHRSGSSVPTVGALIGHMVVSISMWACRCVPHCGPFIPFCRASGRPSHRLRT